MSTLFSSDVCNGHVDTQSEDLLSLQLQVDYKLRNISVLCCNAVDGTIQTPLYTVR
jgi:hypothetical protein